MHVSKPVDKSNSLPVSLDALKKQSNIEHSLDDDLLTDYLRAAAEYVGKLCDLELIDATWCLSLPAFHPHRHRHNHRIHPIHRTHVIELDKRPAEEIVSVQYYDQDNLLQTLPSTSYQFDNFGGGWAKVIFLSCPATYARPDAVQIRYTTEIHDVPCQAQQAIKMLAAHWYEHREAVSELTLKEVPLAVENLCRQISVCEVI